MIDRHPPTLSTCVHRRYTTNWRGNATGRIFAPGNAPTQFGNVACHVKSRLSDGYVEVSVTPPPRPAKTILLRTTLPDGWQIDGVEVNGERTPLLDGNVVDLSGHREPLRVRFAASRRD
jgi:hypothetical protein